MLYVPVNNFFHMSGRFSELNKYEAVLLKRDTKPRPGEIRTRDLAITSPALDQLR